MLFLNPLFLFAAAAGTLPVVIHLMFRRKAKTVFFPSLVFMRQLDREVIRRKRLKEILIMILRILILVLFVIFLAKPILRSNLFLGGASKSVVIIIDDSYSMRAKEDKVLFEKARERALSVINNLGPGDSAAVILASGVVMDGAELSSLSSDFESLRRYAESLAPGYRPANLDLAFRRAREMIEDSGEKSSMIFLVTDMRRKDWQGVRSADTEKDIPLVIVDVASEAVPPNAVIEDVTLSSSADDIARKISNFTVKLHNFSPEKMDITLGMYTDAERLIDETRVLVDAGEDEEIKLVFQAGDVGWHAGYFQLGADSLDVDNRRYFALEVRKQVRVGIYDKRPAPVTSFDRYFYLARAIDPLEQGYPFSVERSSDMTEDALSNYDVLIMATLPDLDSSRFSRLRTFVHEGGKLLLFLDEDVSTKRLEGLCGPGVRTRSFEKGIFKVGREPFDMSRLFLDVDIYKRLPIELPESRAIYSLASFQDGKPFIIEKLHGEGRIILVTTGYDLEMTNLPFRHASVPLLYKILFMLVGISGTEEYICGDSLEIEPAWKLIVKPDGGSFVPGSAESDFLLSAPGLYVAKTQEGRNLVKSRIAAANVDASEGDLTRVRYGELEKVVPFSRWEIIGTDDSIRRRIERYSRGTPLWNYFLYLAIIIFFVELFMANRAGRRV